ncbi:MAG: hypothetical protein P8188_04250 [Gemmatimonadota bacterium]|jgi:Tol biopolymer transport system component
MSPFPSPSPRRLAALALTVAAAACTDSASPTGPEEDPWTGEGFDFTASNLIAFESDRDGNREIYLMTPDGREGVNLTNHPGSDGDISWSPDGSRIAFASNRAGNTEIFIMDVDGSNVTRVTNDPAIDRFPAWSPDGSRIAFASNRDGNFELYMMDATGLNEVRITYDEADDTEPAWLADGTRVVFFSTRSGNGDIWSVTPSGASPVNLTDDPAFDGAPATMARTGDGRVISFVSDRGGGDLDIYTMAADGSSVYRVTSGGGEEFDSSWMADGEKLVFDAFWNGSWNIFVIEASGTNMVQLTQTSADDESPAFRP